MLSSYLPPAIALMSTALAKPCQIRDLPPAFFLAGDSTTAPNGGWGDAFVASLTGGSAGTNFGHSGATTSSFRAGGDWDNVLSAVESHNSTHRPFVTIQFGHNDQKTEEGLAVFVENLVQFDEEVRAAGGEPIFLTSLARRNYEDDGTVRQDLGNVVELTIQAAEQTGARWADLNEASREYLNAIGEENAMTYNLSEDDHTHLNEAGGVVFAGVVAQLLKGLEPSFDSYINVDPELAAALDSGEYYYPE
ncbi:SGNH hydrolase-type esterase domain-containing protein [Aspergillus granulosus]|uniref:SGNH hydrolase-type esterase domain-containing protein n=1 Tax=Aspergillus granulosus TaxID=176169 RepID=A0ABR4HBA0_9EURO